MTFSQGVIRLNGFIFSVFLIFPLLLMAACGGGSEVETDAGSLVEQEGEFIDWDQVDWKFNRHALASAYFFNRLKPNDALRKYEEQAIYAGLMKAASLDEFLAMSPAGQQLRRKEAADEYYRAMALRRILHRGWEIWTQTRVAAVAGQAMSDEMGIITPAIRHLKTAAGLDPSNPFVFYDLGYFAGVIGDRKLQRESFVSGLAALEVQHSGNTNPLWLESDDLARLRLRLFLDQAWLDRDEGYYQAALDVTKQAIAQMAADEMRTLAEAREAVLLQALLVVDLGDVHSARRLAQKLPEWHLPIQKSSKQSGGGNASVPLRKEGLEHIDSKFARDWVYTMIFLKLEEKDQAMARMREKNYVTEYPPHINHRLWRDMGRVLEHFGEHGESNLRYGFSIVYYPYFPYFPLEGARGISRILGQTGTGQTYYLGFHHFYISGSLFSFAANRVVAMEVAQDPAAAKRQAETALDALSICLRKDIRSASSRALRGRVHYRLGNDEAAVADLLQAHRELEADQRPSADVVKLLAVINYDQENFADSRIWLDQFVDMKPSDGFGWRLAGLSMAHMGDLEEAAATLDYARKLDPAALTGWYNLALVHLQRGDVERARALLVEAETHFPGDPDITRLQQLIREDKGSTVTMTSGKVELATSAADSLWFSRATVTSAANVMVGLSQYEVEQLLPKLWERYRLNPDAEHRLILAQTMLQAGQSKEVQVLLGPLWPRNMSGEEAVQLLRADRDRHSPARAKVLAEGLRDDANPYPDSEFWALVAVVCLENGEREAGLAALDLARELDPDNTALQAMAGIR